MPAPAATQKKIDEANALHQEMYGDPQQKGGDLDLIASLPGATLITEEVPAPVVSEPAEPVEPVDVLPEPIEPIEPIAAEEPADFEHKYKVLQGKYNAEVPQLNSQVRGLTDEVSSMQAMLANMQPIQESGTPPKGDTLLSPEEVEEYSPELVDIIKRAAREELAPQIDQLKDENSQLRNALNGMSETAAETSRTSLFRTLDTELPNWKEINRDSDFLNWLEGIDLYSGKQRQVMLTQAFGENNAARVLVFFNGFLTENAVTTSSQAEPPAVITEHKVDLISMAAPGKPMTSPPISAQTEKRVYTQTDIAQFYRSVQLGHFKGREAEKNALEADILAAEPEGRLR